MTRDLVEYRLRDSASTIVKGKVSTSRVRLFGM